MAAALPAGASAATTIGSALPPPPAATFSYNGGSSSLTAFNAVLPAGSTAPGGLTAPAYGVITRFRIETAHSGPGIFATDPLQLRTIDDQGSNHFQMVSTEPTSHPVADVSAIQAFDTRLPIQAGHELGIDAAVASGAPHISAGASLAGATVRTISPRIGDGTSTSGSPFASQRLLLQADVEPDADHDAYGDESQDCAPSDPGVHDGCGVTAPTKKKCKKKKKAKKRSAAAAKKCKKKRKK